MQCSNYELNVLTRDECEAAASVVNMPFKSHADETTLVPAPYCVVINNEVYFNKNDENASGICRGIYL